MLFAKFLTYSNSPPKITLQFFSIIRHLHVSQRTLQQFLLRVLNFWLQFGLRHILRPEINRTSIMSMATTSRTHIIVPRFKKTKPSSQSMISIAATTKSKSSNPVFKASLILLSRKFLFNMCDCEPTLTVIM
jgi:hypothetical protein